MAKKQQLTGSAMALVLAALVSAPQAAYVMPDTLWVKVTFYDYHYGGLNPNFGAGNCGTQRGMVQDTLDRDRKPVFKADLCYNSRLNEWYRPSGGTGATFDPTTGRWSGLVARPSATNEWIGASWNAGDAMANIVMYDSLPFVPAAGADSTTGIYEFVRTNAQAFYWLDGRGFGVEPAGSGHNYGFSMELHHTFTYQGGEQFSFAGDDDVWVFINGKLALDLGGMQSATRRTIYLDQMTAELGITVGNKYTFDFFYNERHEPQSDCSITTNILTPSSPAFISVTRSPIPPDPNNPPPPYISVAAGDTFTLYAWVFDDSLGVRPDWDSSLIWQVIDTMGNPISQTVFRGGQGDFLLTQAYGDVTLIITYYDPQYPDIMLERVVTLHVDPGPADHLSIEGSADSTLSLRADNPIDEVTIAPTQTTFPVYAVLRDRYGNWVSHANPTEWTSVDISVVRVAVGQAALGECIISREGTYGQTKVAALSSGLRDTVLVRLESVPFDGLRIVGADVVRDTLRIGVGIATTLYALGHNTASGAWDTVEVRWDAMGPTFTPSAPAWDDRWVGLSPHAADTGIIYIRKPGLNNVTLSDTIVVLVEQRIPSSTPHHIVIEGSMNWAVSPTVDNPVDTVYLAANERTARVYAIVRDQFGTFYDYSRATAWSSNPTSVATVVGGMITVGEGVISRVASGAGTALVIAENATLPGLVVRRDTTVVVLLGYSYTEVRIVVSGTSGNVPITELVMAALRDTTLMAEGRRSSDGVWEPLQVRWTNSLGLPVSPDAPERAGQWTLQLTQTGDSGWVEIVFADSLRYRIRVEALPDTTVLRPNHLVVEGDLARAAGPVENELDTLRIPSNQTTGLLYAVVRDRSGSYVRFSQGTVWQSLDSNIVTVAAGRAVIGEAVVTKVGSTGIALVVAIDPSTDLIVATDTVVVKLLGYYYTALRLLVNGVVVDTLNMRLDSGVVLTVQAQRSDNGGWEQTSAGWSVSGLSLLVAPPTSSATFALNSSVIGAPGTGSVTATAGGLSTTLPVIIRPNPNDTTHPAHLVAAVTRDSDGDGYLDCVELTYDYPVTLPLEPASSFFHLTSGGTVFGVDSIVGATGLLDTRFTLYLDEHSSGALETGLRPTLSYGTGGNLPLQPGFVCADGAGPVASRAIVFTGVGNAPDTLRIYLSESVDALPAGTLPADVLRYYRDDTLLSVLAGLPASALTYNGEYLTVVLSDTSFVASALRDSVQLVANSAALQDTSGNRPPADGRRAPVQVRTKSDVTLRAGPNPFVPGVTQLPAPARAFYSNVVGSNTSGIIVGVASNTPLSVRSDGSYGKASVYDAVGNIVVANLLVRGTSNPNSYGLFWDGRNSNGRMVGGGAYLCVVSVKDMNGKTTTDRVPVGVSRQ